MADSYLDRHQRHELYLQRLATELLNRYAYPNIQAAYKAVRLAILDADEITSNTKLDRLNREIVAVVKEVSQPNWEQITAQLQAASVYEAGFYATLLGDVNDVSLSTPVDKKILDYVNKSIMSLSSGKHKRSGVWQKFVDENINSISSAAINQVTDSYQRQLSANQTIKAVKEVYGTATKQQAEALVRTGMSHFSVNAREAMADDNRDIIKKRWFSSVFDNRTTDTCMAASSSPKNPWDIDDKTAPILPLHFNERSSWVFLLEGQNEPMGTKAAIGGKDTEEAEAQFKRRQEALEKRRSNPNITGDTTSQVKYRGRRDSETFKAGQVTEHRSAEWLSKQPRWFVEDTLGKERARLFLDEGYPLTKFTDTTFRPLTLEQIIANGI